MTNGAKTRQAARNVGLLVRLWARSASRVRHMHTPLLFRFRDGFIVTSHRNAWKWKRLVYTNVLHCSIGDPSSLTRGFPLQLVEHVARCRSGSTEARPLRLIRSLTLHQAWLMSIVLDAVLAVLQLAMLGSCLSVILHGLRQAWNSALRGWVHRCVYVTPT